MYNERKDSFSFRDIIIQALFVILFIFVLIWFFPSKSSIKGDIKDAIADASIDVNVNSDKTKVFNDNANSMKEAAKSYFTLARLPQKTGDKVTITLSEMLEKKIILPFVDHEGKQCDLHNSYVEVVKMDDEYIMKINLECGDSKDYVLVHMGCYNYCETDICEKKDDKKTTPTGKQPSPSKNNPKPIVNVKYEYEYKKETKSSYSNWSDWSAWSTTKVEKNNLRDVRTTTETTSSQVVSHYETVYKTENVYETRLVGTRQTSTCEEYYTIGDGSNTYKWVQVGTTKSPGSSSSTKKYEYVEEWGYDSLGIPVKTGYYKIFELQHQTKTCTKYKTENVYETVKVGTKQVPNGTRPVYKTVQNTVTKYSYRTRTLIPAKVEYKWSSDNDQTLLKAGYVKTGKKKEI